MKFSGDCILLTLFSQENIMFLFGPSPFLSYVLRILGNLDHHLGDIDFSFNLFIRSAHHGLGQGDGFALRAFPFCFTFGSSKWAFTLPVTYLSTTTAG